MTSYEIQRGVEGLGEALAKEQKCLLLETGVRAPSLILVVSEKTYL